MKYLFTLVLVACLSFVYSAEHDHKKCEVVKEHIEAFKELRAKHKAEIDAFVADKPALKKRLEIRREKMNKLREKRKACRPDKMRNKHRADKKDNKHYNRKQH